MDKIGKEKEKRSVKKITRSSVDGKLLEEWQLS